MISDDKVREVRSRTAILDIVSEYVRLKKSGANYLGLCPFHHEKTPSFNVNPAKEIFHCFGCGVGGDVFGFVMRIEGLSFPEAVRFLARRAGIAVEDRLPTPEEKRRADERESCYRIIDNVARFYTRMLVENKEGEPGRQYLERRGVDLGSAGACRLGFAPNRWDVLTRYLEKTNIALEAAEKLGVVRRKEGGGYYDIFRNRLLFAISDPQGRCIGFGGRVLDDSLPKYLNTPESSIYHKSEVLYGLDLAKQVIREKGCVFIVEGYFDHLSLFKAGVKNVVATCGTALTNAHVKLLKRHADRIYVLFDADSAGKKATFRAMDNFIEEDLSCHVVLLPDGEDPDSFILKYGVEAFEEKVRNSLPVFEYFLHEQCRQTDTGSVEGKVKVLEELAPRLEKMTNPVERDLYIREVARLIGVEENILLKRVNLKGAPLPGKTQVLRKEKAKSGIGAEEMLLSLMGKFPQVAERVKEFGISLLFRQDLIPVAESILAQISTNSEIDWPKILEQVGSAEERNRLASLFVDDSHLEDIDAEKAFRQCRLVLERAALREMKALAKELAAAEPGSDTYNQLLEKIDSLRNRKSCLY
ncbi:MAG TPA: DNA primase [Geobacteraceae bacterium]|nr:DNA primase [Geobacteraceae bacterium]